MNRITAIVAAITLAASVTGASAGGMEVSKPEKKVVVVPGASSSLAGPAVLGALGVVLVAAALSSGSH